MGVRGGISGAKIVKSGKTGQGNNFLAIINIRMTESILKDYLTLTKEYYDYVKVVFSFGRNVC